jgi:uncharacterized protein YhhL (DUF1145 family)
MGVVRLDGILVKGVALVFLELDYFWDVSEEDLNFLVDIRLILLNYVHLVQILILLSATDII